MKIETYLDYVRRQTPQPLALPFVHTTKGFNFMDIMSASALLPTHCKVMGGDVLYLFVGLAAYKTGDPSQYDKRIEGAPICFVLNRSCVSSVDRCFPFDTGCIDFARSEYGIGKEFKIEKYSISNDINAPEKIISGFFGSNKNYLWGEVSKAASASVSALDFQSIALMNLISSGENNGIDERISTIEVQVENSITLSKDTVMAIVAPDIVAVSPEFHGIAEQFEADIIKYRWRRASNAQRAVMVEEAILDYLESKGLF